MGVCPQWYYRREGAIQDETIGPISEDDAAALIRHRKLKPTTWVLSPEVTAGQWVQLSGVDFSGPLEKLDRRLKQEQERLEEFQRQEQVAQARAAEENARAYQEQQERQARAQQEVAEREAHARAEYLKSVQSDRRRYKVVVCEPNAAEPMCNRMGFEGWNLEQAFAESFSYPVCGGCGQPEVRRQFVLVFSQPLNPQ